MERGRRDDRGCTAEPLAHKAVLVDGQTDRPWYRLMRADGGGRARGEWMTSTVSESLMSSVVPIIVSQRHLERGGCSVRMLKPHEDAIC